VCSCVAILVFVMIRIYLKVCQVMFQHIVAVVDKAYSDLNIPLGCSSGFNVDVFGSISEQVRMVKEAQSHLFKASEDDGSAHENVTADNTLAENRDSERQHIDDKRHGERVEAVKTEHHSSPQRPPSRVDKSKSQKVQHRSRMIYNHANAVKADEQEVKRVSKEESMTVMSTQKLHKSNSTQEKHRSEAASLHEHDTKSDVSKTEKHKKSGTTNDVQQQSMVKKSTAVKVKSVIVKPADVAHTHRNSSVHNGSCQKSSGPKSDDDVSRRVLCSFDEVHQICLFCIVDLRRVAVVMGTLHCCTHLTSLDRTLLSTSVCPSVCQMRAP